MPRKKGKNPRFPGMVRPHLLLTDAEMWEIELARSKIKMERLDYLRSCILYVARKHIDPRK